MKKISTFIACIILTCALNAQKQTKSQNAIRAVLEIQTQAWNAGDLPKFMSTYWQSDSLRFVGKSGLTYGWQKTLDNYQKNYPNKEAMGQLDFNILSIEVLSKRSAFVIGKWHLARTIGDLSGHFTLLFRKIEGKWVIVADHSS
jgi:ketosteroid isomerase-like protein